MLKMPKKKAKSSKALSKKKNYLVPFIATSAVLGSLALGVYILNQKSKKNSELQGVITAQNPPLQKVTTDQNPPLQKVITAQDTQLQKTTDQLIQLQQTTNRLNELLARTNERIRRINVINNEQLKQRLLEQENKYKEELEKLRNTITPDQLNAVTKAIAEQSMKEVETKNTAMYEQLQTILAKRSNELNSPTPPRSSSNSSLGLSLLEKYLIEGPQKANEFLNQNLDLKDTYTYITEFEKEFQKIVTTVLNFNFIPENPAQANSPLTLSQMDKLQFQLSLNELLQNDFRLNNVDSEVKNNMHSIAQWIFKNITLTSKVFLSSLLANCDAGNTFSLCNIYNFFNKTSGNNKTRFQIYYTDI